MTNNIDKVLEHMIKLSGEEGISGAYENSVIHINFKVLEKFDLNAADDMYRLSYVADSYCSPAEIRFKKEDIKSATYYAESEFKEYIHLEVIQIVFVDDSQLDLFDDFRL